MRVRFGVGDRSRSSGGALFRPGILITKRGSSIALVERDSEVAGGIPCLDVNMFLAGMRIVNGGKLDSVFLVETDFLAVSLTSLACC